ncbi:VWA domain-containing protein [Saccharopolyspora endophytica]|uniref:VWA domain-containing protein n=1 Tax=Saccharopolyspora endophytica TaxID=543886 RepID=A0ABS5DPX7_9PSEU|nr:VWA domain-containing protein [Saccharopolyspora endophytica]MBQ0928360.1 VWA domain-containing protein [Saccharopolyspora endophytica]
MGGLSFATPAWLWLLVLVAALAVGYFLVQRRRLRYTVTLTNLDLLASVMPKRPAWRRHVPPALLLLATLIMVLGLSGPTVRMPDPSRDSVVMLAVDISPSMLANDVPPNRSEVMKSAVRDFLDSVPDDTRVGLVSFAASANVDVPPTQDHQAVTDALGRLQFQSNTSLSQAVLTALNTLRTTGGSSAGIVLLSDGASNTGPPPEAAIDAARAAKVPVSTIALGTPTGKVQLSRGPVDVPLDTRELERFARDTGGLTFTAANEAQLQAIYSNIGESVTPPIVPVDISSWFFLSALISMVAAAALSLVWFARMP